MREFFNVLFDKGEGICTGDAFATEVLKYAKEGEFFCVNPLDLYKDHGAFLDEEKYDEYKPRRADFNVTTFRNFIFEMDSMPLEDQLKIFRNSEIPFTAITYSGSKSYHAILSVDPWACDQPHTLDGIDHYKLVWRRLTAKLDREAVQMGYKYPDGKGSFIDASCKNPSRLTRYPEVFRDNGNKQELVQLTERMDREEFLTLLSNCPMISSSRREEFDAPEGEVTTLEQFQLVCPPELSRKLKIVTWAGAEGMYPYILRYTLWAIDSTNVDKEVFLEFLDKYTFKSLIGRGYPAHKLITAVDHAYRMKGRG